MSTTAIILVAATALILIYNIVNVKLLKHEDAKIIDVWLIASVLATAVYLMMEVK